MGLRLGVGALEAVHALRKLGFSPDDWPDAECVRAVEALNRLASY
jgi:hypothetical protein